MTLGNAGGVDLILDGVEVGSVGARGQVAKVRLPRVDTKKEAIKAEPGAAAGSGSVIKNAE